MKKRLGFLVVAVVALIGFNSIGVSATEDIEEKMAPYQAVINELNEEYPEAGVVLEDLEEIYGNIVKRNLSPEEFKDETVRSWLEVRDWVLLNEFPETMIPLARSMPVLDEANKVEFFVTVEASEDVARAPSDRLRSIHKTVTQVKYYAYGTFYLRAQVFSLTGALGTFSYSSPSIAAGNLHQQHKIISE